MGSRVKEMLDWGRRQKAKAYKAEAGLTVFENLPNKVRQMFEKTGKEHDGRKS